MVYWIASQWQTGGSSIIIVGGEPQTSSSQPASRGLCKTTGLLLVHSVDSLARMPDQMIDLSLAVVVESYVVDPNTLYLELDLDPEICPQFGSGS